MRTAARSFGKADSPGALMEQVDATSDTVNEQGFSNVSNIERKSGNTLDDYIFKTGPKNPPVDTLIRWTANKEPGEDYAKRAKEVVTRRSRQQSEPMRGRYIMKLSIKTVNC